MLKVLLLFVLATVIGAEYRWQGPGPHSQGAIWPLPHTLHCDAGALRFAGRQRFQIKVQTKNHCDIIDNLVKRYSDIIYNRGSLGDHHLFEAEPWQDDKKNETMSTLTIVFKGPCPKWPQFGDVESYTLSVTSDASGGAQLTAPTVWGLRHGMESFSQLVYQPDVMNLNKRMIKPCSVKDSPRFPHRGLLLDTSRHFLSVNKIIEQLELMSYNKYNVLHWHIVDDQSFPFQSLVFPNTTKWGAYSPRHVYSRADVNLILKEARLRGIRVLPEFDSPGHTRSWGTGHPEFLCDCFDDNGKIYDHALPDVTNEHTWDYILALFTEVLSVFPDNYIHLGGDEVTYDFPCWLRNPKIQAFMKRWNFVTGDDVEKFYLGQLYSLVNRARPGVKRIMWQEVVDQNVTSAENVIAHVWKGGNQTEINTEMAMVTSRGFATILSSCWYLNYITYGRDWHNHYRCEPQAFKGSENQMRLVLGGEAAIWGEYVDGTNITPRLWPRASAVAERLWSARNQTSDITDATLARMAEHRCRMMSRGYAVEPDEGPNHCMFIWDDKK